MHSRESLVSLRIIEFIKPLILIKTQHDTKSNNYKNKNIYILFILISVFSIHEFHINITFMSCVINLFTL